MLILCHHDRRLKFALRPIDSMNDAKSTGILKKNETRNDEEHGVNIFNRCADVWDYPDFKRNFNQRWFDFDETFIGKMPIVLMLWRPHRAIRCHEDKMGPSGTAKTDECKKQGRTFVPLPPLGFFASFGYTSTIIFLNCFF